MSFAVIDFETTGFVPKRTDRVVEVGIVLTDDNGRIEQEWATLVNPHRDVGAPHIHRISAEDLLDEPDFADISDHISPHTAAVKQAPGFALRPGDRVVFTGDMNRSRDEWIAAVVAARLTSGGVTKSARVLVAADPDSMSGKAAKARYGVPVVSEAAFERMFDRYLEVA